MSYESDMKQTVQEYAVKLGVDLDQRNIDKFNDFMKNGKVQAAALSTALAAAGTAIVSFLKQQYNLAQSYEDTAKRAHKAVSSIRASETALKSMGKTLNEVRRNKRLKETYDDIVKMNKELEKTLPNITGAMKDVNNLSSEFYKLKSTVSYSLQIIGGDLLNDLRTPIREVTSQLKSIRDWVNEKLPAFSRKVSLYIGDFVRGLKSILDVGKGILDFFNGIDPALKGVLGTITTIALAIKSGPLGLILAAVEALGDLKRDWENYNWNKDNGFVDGNGDVYSSFDKWATDQGYSKGEDGNYRDKSGNVVDENTQGPVNLGMAGAWKIFGDNTKDVSEKITGISDEIFGGISKSLQEKGGIGGIISSWLSDSNGEETNNEALTRIGQSVVDVIKTGIQTYGNVSSDIFGAIFSALTGESVNSYLEENPVSNAVSQGIITGILSGNEKTGVISALIGLVTSDNISSDDYKKFGIGISKTLKTAIEKAGGTAGELSSSLMLLIAEALGADNIAAAIESNPGVSGAIGTGLITALTTGSIGQGLVAAIAEAIADPSVTWESVEQAGEDMWASIKAGLEKAVDFFTDEGVQTKVRDFCKDLVDFIFGKVDETTGQRKGGIIERLKPVFDEIIEIFKPLGEAIANDIASAFDHLWQKISPYLVVIGAKIEDWFLSSEFGQFLHRFGIVGSSNMDSMHTTYGLAEDGPVSLAHMEEMGYSIPEMAHAYAAGKAHAGTNALNTYGPGLYSLFPKEDGNGFTEKMALATILSSQWATDADFAAIATGEVKPSDVYTRIESQHNSFGPEGFSKEKSGKNSTLGKWFGIDSGITGFDGSIGMPYSQMMSGLIEDVFSGLITPSKFMDDPNRSNGGLKEHSGIIGPFGAPNDDNVVQHGRQPTIEIWDNNSSSSGSKTSAASKLQGSITNMETTLSSKIGSGNTTASSILTKLGTGVTVIGKTNAYGGRYDSPVFSSLAEDGGTEYVIPIDKPQRAKSLISSMLAEMGTSAGSILASVGLDGGIGTLGGGFSAGLDMVSGSNSVVYNNNISANNTFIVNGTGNAEDIGIAAYNASERYLIRTLQGVMA